MPSSPVPLPLLILLLLTLCTSRVQTADNRQTYIVHVTAPSDHTLVELEDFESYYGSFIPAPLKGDEEKPRSLLHSYRNVMSGFAARLTSEEASTLQGKRGVLFARPENVLNLLTTHSPMFLGLPQQQGFGIDSNLGEGMIIGVLDGGVLPSHPSFSGDDMPPPPAKWKGRCDFKPQECNNKIIGARSFDLSGNSTAAALPLDVDGHGTHTASTAAGVFVQEAEALGNAHGTAVGMAPRAHLAIYKVCFGEHCPEANILAGLDAAIEDGVDVVSLSVGYDTSRPYFNDTIAIGTFAAVQRGIFASCSAGNFGPFQSSVRNEAPWILTVGASTIDRNVVATAKLGNGMAFEGETLFQPNLPPTYLPLVYAGSSSNPNSSLCAPGSLRGSNVEGKVVLCERGVFRRIEKGQEVKDAGGAAMILMNDESSGFSTIVDPHVLPAVHVSHAAGVQIKAYINSTEAPTATILFNGTRIGNPNAPAVTSFSSRGPSTASPGILKPDIIGPGVSILAAWPFPLNNDTKSKLTFNIQSGTSMSCPHLSGIAALLKRAHPDWSPAAIKSAIMTTANQLNLKRSPIVDEQLQPADVFAIGSGHVNPLKANDPGLVYDITPDDYIPYICSLGYTDQQVSTVVGRSITCSEWPKIPQGQLNYPSFSLVLRSSQTVTRTVTNVGNPNSTYVVTVIPPPGVYVTVKPIMLYFSNANQKATYSVTFTVYGSKVSNYMQGYLKWTSGKYSVRSPISIQF
ncbi:hypothetical protein MLD38_010466 [Melastoma candidum]|uniref:Uncharacterized protein n=1 Tax=Melastoma candidum TaxID=119954 RepID=A0ACB9R893_9MYRT|nr:hypothetical protein MLD38_010466 [Melastoma candidum]